MRDRVADRGDVRETTDVVQSPRVFRGREALVRQAAQQSTYPTCNTAQEFLELLDAATAVLPWMLVPSDVPANQVEALGRARQRLLDALEPFRNPS